MKQVWRSIEGCDGYSVSDAGQVKGKGGKLLKQFPSGGWVTHYMAVAIYSGTHQTRKQFYVHRLVAAAFCARPDDQHVQVNHIDKDRTNNRASNLEWVTAKKNCAHRDAA